VTSQPQLTYHVKTSALRYLFVIAIIISIIFNLVVVFVDIPSLTDHFTSEYKRKNILHVTPTTVWNHFVAFLNDGIEKEHFPKLNIQLSNMVHYFRASIITEQWYDTSGLGAESICRNAPDISEYILLINIIFVRVPLFDYKFSGDFVLWGDNFRSQNVFKEQMDYLALTQMIKVPNMLGVFVVVLSFQETVGIIIEVDHKSSPMSSSLHLLKLLNNQRIVCFRF